MINCTHDVNGVCDDCFNEFFRIKQAEPTRAIYYGVFFRNKDGRPQVATDFFFSQREFAEWHIRLEQEKGSSVSYFIGTVSVPVSEVEA